MVRNFGEESKDDLFLCGNNYLSLLFCSGCIIFWEMGNRLKEDEKIERTIRSLLKHPQNKRCINCNSLVWHLLYMFSYLFGVCPSLLYGPYTSEIKSINNGSSSAALYQGKQQNPQFVIFCKCMVNYVLDFLLHSRRTVLRKIYEKILKKYICFFVKNLIIFWWKAQFRTFSLTSKCSTLFLTCILCAGTTICLHNLLDICVYKL